MKKIPPIIIKALDRQGHIEKLKVILEQEKTDLDDLLAEREKVEMSDQGPNVREMYIELADTETYIKALELRIVDLSK